MSLFGNSLNKEREEPEEVNMTAVMNIFLILIPFLLLTAVFAKIAVLEVSMPTGSGGSGSGAPPEKSVLVVIKVGNAGSLHIQTSSKDVLFEQLYATSDGKHDLEQLVIQLKELKEKIPWLDVIVLQPEDNVVYDIIVKIMDKCRENGFENVSLAT